MMSDDIKSRLAAIKLLILDVDGILTDGSLWYGADGEIVKAFHVHDGLGIKRLIGQGVDVAIITSRESQAVTIRAQELGIKHIYQKQAAKLQAFIELLQLLKLTEADVAYMGDDIPDLEVMERVAIAVTVPNAVQAIKDKADFITNLSGGKGAVREFCDMIYDEKQNTPTP